MSLFTKISLMNGNTSILNMVLVRIDNECLWSDGNIGGYCTEFYKNDIEIGNIVNTLAPA